jgi:hypothetical protein
MLVVQTRTNLRRINAQLSLSVGEWQEGEWQGDDRGDNGNYLLISTYGIGPTTSS